MESNAIMSALNLDLIKLETIDTWRTPVDEGTLAQSDTINFTTRNNQETFRKDKEL